MIENIANTTQPAAASAQSATPAGETLCQTPFGDVLVDALSTPDIQALFDRRATGGATDAESAALQAALNQSAATPTETAATQVVAASQNTNVSSATPAALATPAAQPTAGNTVPTAQSAFGDSPWLTNPTGSSDQGTTWQFNPIYFASQQTAQTIANLVGGTVVEENAMLGAYDGPYHQDEMNNMVELSNGALINPGLVADFYDHGYSQANIDQMIQWEVAGATAV